MRGRTRQLGHRLADFFHQRTRINIARRSAQDIGHQITCRCGDAIEQHQTGIFGHRRSIDRGPECGQVEQVLGSQECRCNLVQFCPFLFGKFEGMDHAHAVDDPVGQLGCDNLAAQLVGFDLRLELLAHRLGEGREQSRLEQRVVG